jgi:hypothetical protein
MDPASYDNLAYSQHCILAECIPIQQWHIGYPITQVHQGREIIAIIPLEYGAFCTIFSENFHKF